MFDESTMHGKALAQHITIAFLLSREALRTEKGITEIQDALVAALEKHAPPAGEATEAVIPAAVAELNALFTTASALRKYPSTP